MSRFVIVAHPRTGSHALASALEARGDVVCDLEPYSQDGQGLGATLELCDLWQYLEQTSKAKAIGFILHRTQGHRGQPGAGVWDQLSQDKAAKIIILGRRDQLARYCSHQLARRTGNYTKPTDPSETLELDPGRFLQDVARYWRLLGVAQGRFADRQTQGVELEDLVQDQQASRAITEYLGLGPTGFRLDPAHQQDRRPLSDIVSNWATLPSSIQML